MSETHQALKSLRTEMSIAISDLDIKYGLHIQDNNTDPVMSFVVDYLDLYPDDVDVINAGLLLRDYYDIESTLTEPEATTPL